MRVFKNISTMFISAMVMLVMLTASLESVAASHACCPEGTSARQSGELHNLVSHYQHSAQLNEGGLMNEAGLAASHDGMIHGAGSPASSPDLLCQVSCCANITSFAIPMAAALVDQGWTFSNQAYHPGGDIAFSAAENLHTPPPRLSIIA